jgi:hypothetical protein
MVDDDTTLALALALREREREVEGEGIGFDSCALHTLWNDVGWLASATELPSALRT